MANKNNRYFIPVNGTLIEVSEEVYRAFYQPVLSTLYQRRARGADRSGAGQGR